MKNVAPTLLLLLSGALSCVTLAQSGKDDLKPFPPPQAGRQRVVIRLAEVPNPGDLKVEVMIGKTIMVDCNRHSFRGTLSQEEVTGWGYSYYVLDALRGPSSTMMACPPGAPRHEEFVQVPAPLLAALRYNAKVPIVIYVPAGTQVRYRIWSAGSQIRTAGAE